MTYPSDRLDRLSPILDSYDTGYIRACLEANWNFISLNDRMEIVEYIVRRDDPRWELTRRDDWWTKEP